MKKKLLKKLMIISIWIVFVKKISFLFEEIVKIIIYIFIIQIIVNLLILFQMYNWYYYFILDNGNILFFSKDKIFNVS